jgi:predicted nucleic acid-binding protein
LKFGWSEEAIRVTGDRIRDFTARVDPLRTVQVVTEDPADDRILECAVAAGSEYIVTGDRHLLKMGRYGEAKIVKPTEFLEIVELQRR